VIVDIIARGNSDRTTIAAHTTSRASRASTIQIIAVAAIISKTEIASTIISIIIVSVIAVAAASTIVVVVVVAVTVAVDSFMANKASAIFATGETSGIVEHLHVTGTAIAVTHRIQ